MGKMARQSRKVVQQEREMAGLTEKLQQRRHKTRIALQQIVTVLLVIVAWDLKQTTTETATKTSLNKRFNEQY